MEALALFNIGFRCENISQALQEYSEKKTFNKMIIEDSDSIINESFSISDSLAEHINVGKSNFPQLMPLIFEVIQERDSNTFMEKFSRIMNTVQDVKKGSKDVDVQEAVDFFRNLSNVCLSRNTVSQFNMAYLVP